ncbi:MAG: nitroreductase, partial [Pseudomonadota bacterium]
VVEGDARNALGDVFAEAIKLRDPDAAPEQVERQRDKPLRSPLLIVVVAAIQPGNPKVPEFEQLLSAGVAAEHMQLAASAMGYGSVWVTGPNALDSTVHAALGLGEHDQIAGFLHFGTSKIDTPQVKRPDPEQFIEHWTGAS